MTTTGSGAQPLAAALEALWAGDLDYRMPETPETAGIAEKHNQFLRRMQYLRSQHSRITREVRTQGLFGGQAEVDDLSGAWKELVDDLNTMASSLTDQIRDFACTTTAIANGSFMQKASAPCDGEMADWKRTINIFVDQLNQIACEITRVVREIGTEGKLGPQAEARGVAGTWKDLVDNVNTMSANLTRQIRSISEVTHAIARGDYSKKITVDASGETLELINSINSMVK